MGHELIMDVSARTVCFVTSRFHFVMGCWAVWFWKGYPMLGYVGWGDICRTSFFAKLACKEDNIGTLTREKKKDWGLEMR